MNLCANPAATVLHVGAEATGRACRNRIKRYPPQCGSTAVFVLLFYAKFMGP